MFFVTLPRILKCLVSFESDYHYGSDFGDSSDDNEPDDDLLLTESESDSLENENNDVDSDYSISSFSHEGNQKRTNRQPSPDPLWLQQIDYPALTLPDSSDDLFIPKEYALKAASIYEVFRRFRHLIRLSPFRFEDFCAALVSDEQTVLLCEIHIMLLKALLREDDAQTTHFGPLDHKDSINISLYLVDQITWPEVLRSYIASDKSVEPSILAILTTKDYPYVSVDEKLAVLQFLTNNFLVTTCVRDNLLQEGPIHYDDHCRICHRLGDLLCCETCPAVIHLECNNPPLAAVPTEEDWQCDLCKSHQVAGVQDCISSQEKQGFLCRQENLGYDRHGRKYWFIARRLFVENEETGEIWYYSSAQQFEQLISVLDEDEMEYALCREIEEYQEEIQRQMTITETVTNKNKGNKKSYLDVANQNILDKMKREKENTAAAEAALENGNADKDDEKNDDKTTEEKVTDKSEASDGEKTEEPPVAPMPVKNVVSTRLKTGSLTPRNYSTDDLKRKNSISNNKDDDKLGSDGETRLTRNKLNEISKGTLLFKLGMENTSNSYVNQYSVNPFALNKPQRNEERDKRRYLSHKFSLTTASEFKWIGVLNSTHTNVISMLRQTITALEQGIAKPFMHTNWPALRKVWVQAIANSSKPEDFAKVLVILQMCMKSPLFANVWHEQLGHIHLQRITSAEREEKKKLEKREKRERDDEEERNRLANNFVKYSLGLKHQVWKQKGEEYRIHGQWGWIWMSYGRRQNKSKATVYERMKPNQIVTKVKNQSVEKVVSLQPSVYEFLKKSKKSTKKDRTDVPLELKNVEVIDTIDSFDNINVSSALAARNRLLYPKVAKKSLLDDLLRHRVQLQQIEQQKIAVNQANPSAEPQAHIITKSLGNKSSTTEKQLQKIAGIKSGVSSSASNTPAIPNVDMEFVNSMAKSILVTRLHFSTLNRFGKQYKCYNRDCNVNTQAFSVTQVNVLSCYSPLCLQKARAKKQLLTLLRKASAGSKETHVAIMNIVNRKPSILEQKLTEGKSNDATGAEEEPSASDEIDPQQVKSLFVNAFSRGSTPNDAADIDALLVAASDQSKEQKVKEECKVEDQELKVAEIKKESPMETNESNGADVDKMDIDEELSNQQPIMETTRDVDESTTDVDVISNQDDQSNSAEKDSLSTNSDEITRERRSSRRSVKGRTSTRTTTTTTQTTTKYDDGSEESETNSTTKTRSKDVNYDSNKVSTTITASRVSTYVQKINRRFAAISMRGAKKEKMFKYESEIAPDGTERVYSTESSCGKVYLNKIILDGNNKKIKKQSKLLPAKYPDLCRFLTKKATASIMVLHRYEVLNLARSGGKMATNGFHHLAKNNTAVWPYPCSRPLFKTCWQFRTMNSKTLASVALQLRILWSCLRWDDMVTKPPTTDGKHQVTTESEIMTLEILKHRVAGRFSEKIEYLRRRIVIPLELPKTIRGEFAMAIIEFCKKKLILFMLFKNISAEVTSIRSGLRKRKRAESPQKTDPQVSEEWVDESSLELWEIKLFGERCVSIEKFHNSAEYKLKLPFLSRQEKMNFQPITRASTGKLPTNRPSHQASTTAEANKTAASGSPATANKTANKIIVSHKATPEEIKEKMEEQLRLQRAAHNKKRALENARNQGMLDY